MDIMHYRSYSKVDLFSRAYTIVDLISYFRSFFQHIFKHINAPFRTYLEIPINVGPRMEGVLLASASGKESKRGLNHLRNSPYQTLYL